MKQPFYVHDRAGGMLGLAGFYEFWRDRDKPAEGRRRVGTTFTIITTSATDVGHIHDRMPTTVAADDWEAWLDPDTIRASVSWEQVKLITSIQQCDESVSVVLGLVGSENV